MVWLTREPIDASQVVERVGSAQAGAVVLFLGTVRQWTGDEETLWLDYEGYAEMAEQKLAELEAEARRRWPVIEAALVHRLGRIELGEPSVAVAVSTPHRREAFEAASWLIDTLKQVVPIWKQEHWADGRSAWVHPQPGADPTSVDVTPGGPSP